MSFGAPLDEEIATGHGDSDLAANPGALNVLFVSPYGMEPPIHGGAVFMNLIEKTFGKEVTTRTWETIAKCVAAAG